MNTNSEKIKKVLLGIRVSRDLHFRFKEACLKKRQSLQETIEKCMIKVIEAEEKKT